MNTGLPSGWKKATLGELGKWSSGGTPARKNASYYGGNIPWVKTGDLRDNIISSVPENITEEGLLSSSAKLFPCGSLLIAMYGATIGRSGVLSFDAATNQACAALLSNGITSDIIPYVWKFIRSSSEKLKAAGKGGAQPNISQTLIKDFSIPLAPLKEQRRIVEKVDTLMERSNQAKEALDAIPALLDQYRQSVLAAAYRGDLTKDWRKQNLDIQPASVFLERIRKDRALQKLKYTPLEEETIQELRDLPNGWSWAKLPELGELARGKSKHRPRNDPRLFGDDYPFIQTGEVSGANGYVTAYSKSLSEFGLAQSHLWSKGTVCITIAANIAESAILDIDACFPDSIVGFIANEEITSPEYVEFFIRTAKEDLEAFAPATAQKNINLNTLYDVCVPVPPAEEQRRIISAISSAFSMISNVADCYEQSQNNLDTLNQSILAKAFRGELVPQDPNDEPALVLLERIRAERQVVQPIKPKRVRQKSA